MTPLPLPWPDGLEATRVTLSPLALATSVVTGWLVMLGEIVLPVLVVWGGRSRSAGLAGLLLMQLAIAVLSKELSFAVASAATLCLWLPAGARFAYPVVAVLMVVAWGAVYAGVR
jgi:hypothetical protein